MHYRDPKPPTNDGFTGGVLRVAKRCSFRSSQAALACWFKYTKVKNNDENMPVVYSYVMYDISWAYFILDRKCKVQLLQKKKL